MLILFVHHLDRRVRPHLIITESGPLKRLLDLFGRANKGHIRHGTRLSLDTGSV